MRKIKLFSITGIIFLFTFIGGDLNGKPTIVHGITRECVVVKRQANIQTIPQEIIIESRMPSYKVNARKVKVAKVEVKVKEDMTQENATMISLSDEDKLLLAKAIYAEAGICGVAEQEAVGITILNRAKQDNCSIYEVLTAPGQFSSVINGKPSMIVNKTVVPIEEEHITSQVWEVVEILSEGKETEVEKLLREEAERLGLDVEKYAEGGPLYFYNPDAVSQKQIDSRKNVKCSVKIGYQIFYKFWDT